MSADGQMARWLAPIDPGAPSGHDARTEAEHEAVRAEVAKLTSLSGGSVDWAKVVQHASALLSQKSKDLLIASYLTAGLLERQGLSGLVEGLNLLSGLLQDFSRDLFPQRTRGRANAVAWLVERASARLSELPPQDQALAEQALTAFEKFSAATRSALPGESVLLVPLERSLQRLAATGITPPEQKAAAAQLGSVEGAPVEARTAPLSGPASAERWLQPFPGTPAGVDCSLDETYEGVCQEIEKLQSLSGAQPDWQRVLDHSSALLETRTKDLALFVYLGAALTALQGAEGMCLGLSALTGVLERYWDCVFPVGRLKRRVGLLEWSCERWARALEDSAVRHSPGPILQSLCENLDEFSGAVTDRLGDDVPASLRALLAEQQRLRHELAARPEQPLAGPAVPPEPRSAPARPDTPESEAPARPTLDGNDLPARALDESETPPRPAPESNVDAAPPVVPEPPTRAEDILPFLRRMGQNVVEASRTLFEQDRKDARAYRLLRVGLWLSVSGPPTADANGRTRLAFPDRRARSSLERALSAGAWESALVQAEGMVRRNPFWLDAHWMAARCLEGLGAEYAVAQKAVEHEARAFVGRYPTLLSLKFLDGSPLASEESAAWFVPPRAPPQGEPREPPPSGEFEEALARGAPDALREAESRLSTCGPRAAFELRLLLAQGLDAAGKTQASLALLLSLEQDLDRYRLDEWEPDLALRALRALHRHLSPPNTASAKGVALSDVQRICARLARLAPSALL